MQGRNCCAPALPLKAPGTYRGNWGRRKALSLPAMAVLGIIFSFLSARPAIIMVSGQAADAAVHLGHPSGHRPLSRYPGSGRQYQSPVIAWIMDEYGLRYGFSPACVSGKPLELCGSRGRETAAGRGLLFIARQAASDLGLKLKDARLAIQGFGNVGSNAARFLAEEGCRIVAINDVRGGIYNERGLEIKDLLEHVRKTGSVVGFPSAGAMPGESCSSWIAIS